MSEYSISQPVILEAWKSFIGGGQAEVPVRREVLTAWERSRERGISPDLVVTPRLSDAEVLTRLRDNEMLLRIARPVINTLYQTIKGTGYIVILSDAEGCFLYIVGDKEAMIASSGSVVVGSDWSEDKVGANSIGTAIRTDQPVQMYGYEHYSKISHRWAGSGCPIHDEKGKIVGVLSICCEIENVNPQTFNMVVMVANNIELQLSLNKTAGHLYSVRNMIKKLTENLPEGIVIINADNIIIYANELFRSWVGQEELIGQPLEDLPLEKSLVHGVESGREFIRQDCHVGSSARKFTSKHIMLEEDRPGMLMLFEHAENRQKDKAAKKAINNEAEMRFEDIIGKDARLQYGIKVASVAANTSANILILGESGTGKDIMAQAIHNAGSRRNNPFIAINCAGIPKELFASTLFGYEDGAFTGAKRGGSVGKLELANGGTLFLDEIGEIPYDFQTVLLRALENKRFYRVGGKSVITVDVQIITATNKNLITEVREGRFRQDLYYRLNVLAIHLPPLRERTGDIALLSEYFLEKMCKKYQKRITGFQPDALQLLENYEWPGNIRELQNMIERAVILCEDDEINKDFLTMLIAYSFTEDHIQMINKTVEADSAALFSESQEDLAEDQKIAHLLQKYHWNLSKVSRELGIARSTLYRKIEKYQLNDDSQES